jgi:putative ABC transport system permease protein
MDKIREIAVLKLIGTRNRTIAAMIMQQALARRDWLRGRQDHSHLQHRLFQNMFCSRQWILPPAFCRARDLRLASLVAIRIALKVDPAEAH